MTGTLSISRLFTALEEVVTPLRVENIDEAEKNMEKVQKEYMQLCASQEYLYLLKVPDKKALYARIRAVDELIHKFI